MLRFGCPVAPAGEVPPRPSATPMPRVNVRAQSVDSRGAPPLRSRVAGLLALSPSSCQIAACSTSLLGPSAGKKGLPHWPAPLSYHSFPAGLLRPSGLSHCRRTHIYFDLLRLCFFTLWNRQSQHSVLIVGLDRFRVHGIGKREAPAKRSIRALHTQIILFVHLLLELALTANGQDVIFHTNVQILRIHFRHIGLYDQLMLGLINVDRRRPAREVRFLSRTLQCVTE